MYKVMLTEAVEELKIELDKLEPPKSERKPKREKK